MFLVSYCCISNDNYFYVTFTGQLQCKNDNNTLCYNYSYFLTITNILSYSHYLSVVILNVIFVNSTILCSIYYTVNDICTIQYILNEHQSCHFNIHASMLIVMLMSVKSTTSH